LLRPAAEPGCDWLGRLPTPESGRNFHLFRRRTSQSAAAGESS